MNRIILTICLGFTLSCAKAQDHTTVIDLPWDSPYALKVPSSEITHPDQGPPVLTISIIGTNPGWNEYKATLFRIQNPKITSATYSLTGEVAYQNLGPQSRAQLASSFLETGVIVSTTNADAGLEAYFSGTSDFRPFAINFFGGNPGKLLQLDIGVDLFARLLSSDPKTDGPVGTLSLRNLKLVEYPQPAPPPSPAPTIATPIAPTPAHNLDWTSFWIGAAACAVMLLALAQVALLIRRLQRARHDKEMRRIASIDS